MKWLDSRFMIDIRQVIWLIMLFLIQPATSFAGDIQIISSHGSERYQQVISSFRSRLKQLDIDLSIDQMTLKPAETEKLWLQHTLYEKSQLILSLGSRATQLVLDNDVSTPVVITMVLSEKIVSQRENVRGVVLTIPVNKQLAWLKRLLPEARRVGVLYDPTENASWIELARREAERMELELVAVEVDHPGKLTSALETISRKADVLLAIPDKNVYSSKTLKTIMLSSFRNRIPLVGLSQTWVKAGALYALEANYGVVGEQCAELAYQILQGDVSGDNRYEHPKQLDFVVNLKTARHLFLDIEKELVEKASIVYR